jgi:hypothetical protein
MKTGDRVVLLHISVEASLEYPLQGTKFACGGEIIELFKGQFSGERMAHVLWDNGSAVAIYADRLHLEQPMLKRTNPNMLFLHKKKED